MATELDNATAVPAPGSAPGSAVGSPDDLAEIIRAYNRVTENLQASHERLQDEVVRLREELASTNAQLQRSKRLSALGEMAAGMAHEIRNPLGAIQLYAAMVVEDLEADEPKPDAALDTARKIASAVRGLDGVVNDVLTFAREIEPAPMELSAQDLFERVLEAHRPAIEAAEVEVHGPERDVAVQGDPDLLHQALLNLVRNAVDAMPKAGPRRLTLAARREGQAAVLTVRDSGPGIVDEDVDRIFNPFFTTRNTGTGLGLAIVHRIVDAHGGAICVHNATGAVFELTVPDAQGQGASGPAPGEASEQATEVHGDG